MHVIRAVVVALVVFVLWMYFATRPQVPPRSSDRDARPAVAEQISNPNVYELARGAEARLKMRATWDGIFPAEPQRSAYRIRLVYSSRPQSQAEVERDTREVMQAALDELIARGRQPAREGLFVSVWARMPHTSPTGQTQAVLFGRATYDPFSDSVGYEPMD